MSSNVDVSTIFGKYPKAKLLWDAPAPIEYLDHLTAKVKGHLEFYIKREDYNSGIAFGGNKLRKLEYVVGDALAQGADTLVTTGGVQSNHMRQTTAAANKHGLKTVLAPRDAVPNDSNEYRSLGNVQLSQILGATLLPVGTAEHEAMEYVRNQGGKPYWIPSGASQHPLGGLGYAQCKFICSCQVYNCSIESVPVPITEDVLTYCYCKNHADHRMCPGAFEVIAQEKELGIIFDTILVSCASGSTLGGMVAGFRLAEKTSRNAQPSQTASEPIKRRLIGIQAMTQEKEEITQSVLEIAIKAGSLIGLEPGDITGEEFEIDGRFNAGQYGRLDQKTSDAIKELATLEGIVTDPVYTGKALAAMLHRVRSDEFTTSQRILFVHTGGQSALSAYPELK